MILIKFSREFLYVFPTPIELSVLDIFYCYPSSPCTDFLFLHHDLTCMDCFHGPPHSKVSSWFQPVGGTSRRSEGGVVGEKGESSYFPGYFHNSLPRVGFAPVLKVTTPVRQPSPYGYHLLLCSIKCTLLLLLQTYGM